MYVYLILPPKVVPTLPVVFPFISYILYYYFIF